MAGIEDEETRKQVKEDSVRARRRAAILHEIERRSSEPNLTAIAVATLLGITPRYVHLLLEETGRSFTHHLVACRLETAAALLRDPHWRDRKIADIAAEAGFTDLSYFNRAFRRRYGATPSEIRAAAQDGD
jgi:AraC-like DNA-binding protein